MRWEHGRSGKPLIKVLMVACKGGGGEREREWRRDGERMEEREREGGSEKETQREGGVPRGKSLMENGCAYQLGESGAVDT